LPRNRKVVGSNPTSGSEKAQIRGHEGRRSRTAYLEHTVDGIQDFLGAVGSMVAIALGVLCGYPLYRSPARSLGWLRDHGRA
jgi:hypothetical protein